MKRVDGEVTFRLLADSLADDLIDRVPGERLPSENELQRAYGVSRMTTRSALQELERRHLVRRAQGSGTYVALRIAYPIRAGMPPSWSRHVRAAGHHPEHTVISVTKERAPAALADKLRIRRGRTVTTVTRLGFVDGLVASWHQSHVPLDVAADLIARQDLHQSLTSILMEHYDLEVERLWSRAELASVPARVARPLEMAASETAWSIESVNICQRLRRPIEHTEAWMRADCFRVFLELGDPEDLD